MTKQKENYHRLIGSCRFTLGISNFLCSMVHYAVRSSLYHGVVCMVVPLGMSDNKNESFMQQAVNTSDMTSINYHTSNSSSEIESSCEELTGQIVQYHGEFEWSRELVGHVLSSFFYGYFPVQILGGVLATKFGGKNTMTVAMSVGAAGALLTPLAARLHPYCLIALRALMGMFMGFTFPTLNTMVGRWAPPHERSTLLALSTAGYYLGNIAAGIGSGFLCQYSWTIIHYVVGGCGVLFLIYWQFMAYSTPEEHPRISKMEKKYILDSLNIKESTSKLVGELMQGYRMSQMTLMSHHFPADVLRRAVVIPWRSLLLSPPVWAICAGHFSMVWGFYTVALVVPLYMQDVLKYNIKQNGVISIVPSMISVPLMVVAGPSVDFLVRRCPVSLIALRKIMVFISLTGVLCLILSLSWLDCSSRYLLIPILCFISVFFTINQGGTTPNPQDIAPKYCGVVFGLANCLANLPGLLIPFAVGQLTPHGTQNEWQHVFYLCGGIMAAGLLVFLLFSAGEVQPWAKDEDKDEATTIELLHINGKEEC